MSITQNNTLTVEARIAMLRAQIEAVRLSVPQTSPEHVLLGLLATPTSMAGQALDQLGVDLARTRSSIEFFVKRYQAVGHAHNQQEAPPLAQATQHLLDRAADEVVRLGDGAIGTEHLLLAVLSEQIGKIAIVERYNTDVPTIRSIVAGLPHGAERTQMTAEDQQRLHELAQQLPRKVSREEHWRTDVRDTFARFGGLIKTYPIPLLFIAVWLVYRIVVVVLQRNCTRFCGVEFGPLFQAQDVLLYALYALLFVLGFQMCLPSQRAKYRTLIKDHPLIAGWDAVIILRVFHAAFGYTVWGSSGQDAMSMVVVGITYLWFAIWLILLVRAMVVARRRRRAPVITAATL